MENLEIKLPYQHILVTGATGLVGSHLVEALVRSGHRVTGIGTIENPRSYFYQKGFQSKISSFKTRLENFDSLFDLVTRYEVDFIFHLGAQALVEAAYFNPRNTYETNVMGTVNVLECARLYPKIKGVIVASSDKAYGKLSEGKYSEDLPLKGDHPYESSKSAADLITQTYAQTYQVSTVVTRFGNIYGEGDLNFSRIIPAIFQSLITTNKLVLRSDGTFIRDYLYVKDVVQGYLLLANNISKARGQAYNFGSNDTLSVLELIAQIEEILSCKVQYSIANNSHNEIPYQSLNYRKIKQAFGWEPEFTLKRTLKPLYQWYKQLLHEQS